MLVLALDEDPIDSSDPFGDEFLHRSMELPCEVLCFAEQSVRLLSYSQLIMPT